MQKYKKNYNNIHRVSKKRPTYDLL